MANTKQKTLRIKQVKSLIGFPREQRATVRALGLKHIGDVAEQADTPVIRGMVFKVKHLVEVDEL